MNRKLNTAEIRIVINTLSNKADDERKRAEAQTKAFRKANEDELRRAVISFLDANSTVIFRHLNLEYSYDHSTDAHTLDSYRTVSMNLNDLPMGEQKKLQKAFKFRVAPHIVQDIRYESVYFPAINESFSVPKPLAPRWQRLSDRLSSAFMSGDGTAILSLIANFK